MVVFGGTSALYASHMPMFHAPHDLQVIIQFHLTDTKTQKALGESLSRKVKIWSLDPEDFDLQRLAPNHLNPITEFSARFVEGHFERGGAERYSQQSVVVDKVLMFRRLTGERQARTKGRYHLIGRGHERFLVKEIDRRPDFDVIFKLSEYAKPSLADVVHFPDSRLAFPNFARLNMALLPANEGKHPVGKILYFETEDLQ